MRTSLMFIWIFLSFYCLSIASVSNDELTKNIRTFVSLLDYIGTDYHNAVESGVVKDKNEFAEMNEFAGKAGFLFNKFSMQLNIRYEIQIKSDLNSLRSFISKRKNKVDVLALTNKIKQEILKLNLIQIAPSEWGDIAAGKKVYKNNCVSCHGINGDGKGELAANLSPKPANLLDDKLMSSISPFQIYNTVRLGISGTSMPPFSRLTDEQVWDLSFYVSSLRYQNNNFNVDSLKIFYSNIKSKISLEDAATLSDNELLKKLDNEKFVAAIRLHNENKISNKSIRIASVYLDDVQRFYKNKDYDKAADKALFAYLDGIEPFEAQLVSINSELKGNIESVLYQLRTDIKNHEQFEKIKNDISNAKVLINEAASQLENKRYSFWFAFLFAASIILREGIEAFLIIITILGVLKSVNAIKAVNWVHGGWITALIIGIASMFFVNLIVSFGSQNRELMEGIGSLFAVVLLLYIGFWLHSKTEAKKWKEFVEQKILKLVNGRNMLGLFFLSFIVVFREAFESAIFLSAVNLEVDQANKSGIYLGAASALIVVLILSWIAVKYTAKLPVKKLFKYSALVMTILAVVLVGKGIHALQESGYSSITQIPLHLNFSLFGIYPTIETIVAQSVILIFSIVLWEMNKRIPNKS